MGTAIDLKGRQFGSLTAISPVYINRVRKWQCQCECGKTITKSAGMLRHGAETQSCGCVARARTAERSRVDMAGKRFGRLVAIDYSHTTPNRKPVWNCQCDCGRKCKVMGPAMRSGMAQSCGCLKPERTSERKSAKYEGLRFGRLVVTERTDYITKNKSRPWLCRCDCGGSCLMTSNQLRARGDRASCGCRSKSFEKTGYIYAICDQNGIPIYIGQTIKKSWMQRIAGHIEAAVKRDNAPILLYIKNSGRPLTFRAIASNVPRAMLDEVEIFYIKMLSSQYKLLNVMHNPNPPPRKANYVDYIHGEGAMIAQKLYLWMLVNKFPIHA